MEYAKTPTETVRAGAGDADNNYTRYTLHQPAVKALLHAIMSYPARRVLELAEIIEPDDMPDDDSTAIFTAVLVAAHRLAGSGDTDAMMCPMVIQLDLERTGQLTHGAVAELMVEVTSAQYMPAAWPDVLNLATGLKEQRLRRDMATVGHFLVNAAGGSNEEIVLAVESLLRIPELAQRAGLGVA